jgi:hypothetical protein
MENVTHLAPGIMLFDDVFTNSMFYINKINESDIKWQEAEVLVDENKNTSGTNYRARDTDLILLREYPDEPNPVLGAFRKAFRDQIQPCIDYYVAYHAAKIETMEHPQLLRYGPKQKFHDHIDDHPFFTRRISLTFYLNEEYEGGDVEFPRFNLKFKAKKNQLLMFPSNFVYNHEVHPVTSGVRYVIVQWMA